ncbi:developmental and secondary metabolism regulator VEL1-like [Triticum dicoccoides]|uniref:developmental and secondary metabolism regulator VEL1-like n=1 Tax=Triticum dicoccoides TaxID=85692 RepID=UPI00188E0C18|nr:developmental and secondary metabolism regulator VEL1-like [Triticum dicoccoides]
MVQEPSSSSNHHLQQQLAKYGGGNGNGNGNGAATGVARASRKNKPKKIPQRGLGVAQLEKLRIEEQKKMGGGPSAATPSSHALNGGALCHLPAPTLHHHPPPPPPPLSALSRPAAADHCGFPPALWSPADPAKHPYKRNLCPQPPLPMVSTGLSLTAPSSHPPEPPSNQMYSTRRRSSAAAPAPTEDERETAGVDRSWPFMFEGMTPFTTTSKAFPPPPLPPFAVRTASDSGLADVTPDLSRYEFRATNYFSSASAYPSCSDWTPEFGHCKDTGRSRDAGLLTLSSRPPQLMRQPHVVPSMNIPEYGDFSASAMPSQLGSVSASPSSSALPFYNFLPIGPVDRERAPSERKADVSDGEIDLELKLWKG